MNVRLTVAEAKRFMMYDSIMDLQTTISEKEKILYASNDDVITLSFEEAEKIRLINVLVR